MKSKLVSVVRPFVASIISELITWVLTDVSRCPPCTIRPNIFFKKAFSNCSRFFSVCVNMESYGEREGFRNATPPSYKSQLKFYKLLMNFLLNDLHKITFGFLKF